MKFWWQGPRQANLLLIAYASSEGSGEPAHPRSLARTFAARSYRQWVKRNLQTESQIPGPSEWLDMRSWNLSWRNARRHKFAWRGSHDDKVGIIRNELLFSLISVYTVHNSNCIFCLDALLNGKATLFQVLGWLQQNFWIYNFLGDFYGILKFCVTWKLL